MGLIVDVLRSSGMDCTANGVSSQSDCLLVANVDGPFDPGEYAHRMPIVNVVEGNLPGTVKVVPANIYNQAPERVMMGGNYAASSDARWNRKLEQIAGSRQSGAVPIHDRVEA